METPATIRRNPPRKAKLTSAEKSTVKECRTARKRYVAEGRVLMPSFTATNENSKLKPTEEASFPETLTIAEHESSIRVFDEEISTSGILGFEAENPQCEAPLMRQTKRQASNKVRVFLRIRPAQVVRAGKRHTGKVQRATDTANRSLQQGIRPAAEATITLDVPDVCLLSQTPDCVTLITPTMYAGLHKPKQEEFNGFSCIFNPDSTQRDVFDGVLAPRLADLLEGESSLVVAMGPTSAGKTHTMLGSPADPGLVPRSLQYLFASLKSKNVSTCLKVIISMFEIYSEQGGRPEKIFDLLQDGAELSLQHSKIKGLHEAVAYTLEEAEEIFTKGLQRRTTASTAANHQSSRSHCIFNISTCQVDALISAKQGTLTIADLAGFEREKKTKNQGVRLNESSFINNTSMIFGQCLRALLEHQKNPKKTLQRHFQYSMLTKYLKPYMEANGNMTLIVNVSPCEEDYLDTAFVLRQVAPYSKIRCSSLSIKEKLEILKNEKRPLSSKETQQPTLKRRKVDGAMSKSMDVYDHAKIRKVQKINSDSSNEREELQGEGADAIVNENMKVTRISNEAALPLDKPGNLKANLLAEVNNILIQEGVKSFDHVSHAVMKILGYHASEDLERRLEEQRAEIILLSTNFLKEQQRASALLREVERLKQQYADLEDQFLRLKSSSISTDKDSRPLTSEQPCSASGLITQNNAESQVQGLEDKIHDQDMNGSFLSACPTPVLTKKLNDVNSGKSPVLTTNDVMEDRFEDSSPGLSMIAPSRETMFEGMQTVASQNSLQCSEDKVPYIASHSLVIPFCIDREQNDACACKEDLALDIAALPLTSETPCLDSESYLEGSREGQGACHQALEDGEYHEQEKTQRESLTTPQSESHEQEEAHNERLTSPQISPLLPTYNGLGGKAEEKQADTNNRLSQDVTCNLLPPLPYLRTDKESEKCHGNKSVVAFSADNEREEGGDVCDIKYLGSTGSPLTKEALSLHSKAHPEGVKVGQSACYQDFGDREYHEQHNAQTKSSKIAQLSPMLAGLVDISKADEEQAELKKQSEFNLSFRTKMVARDCKTHLSEEVRQTEIRYKSVSPHVQRELSDRKEVRTVWKEESGLNKDEKSNFEKGKMLALALMQESKNSSDEESDHLGQPVHWCPNSPSGVGTLGPIGHDLEEILEVPLAELERDLWVLEATKDSKISALLAEHCGVLDINNFSKKYSLLRANCLRYCLAVVSGKMNVDGKWVALSEKTLSARKKHFYAVIQARTIAEAAGHARAGFVVEAVSNDSATETKQTKKAGMEEKATQNLGIEVYANKENSRLSSPISNRIDKPNTAIKRRRLQPLSSLSLHGGSNMNASLALADAHVEESKSSYEVSPTVRENKVSTLAYLLTRHNR